MNTNRRSFLKLSGLTGISMLVPPTFLIDNRDAETRFLQYVVETYNDEVALAQLIKSYGFAYHKGRMTDFLSNFVKRQPGVVAFLKSRIKFDKTGANGWKDGCNNPRYVASTRNREMEDKWWKWGKEEFAKLDKRFNLGSMDINAPPPQHPGLTEVLAHLKQPKDVNKRYQSWLYQHRSA